MRTFGFLKKLFAQSPKNQTDRLAELALDSTNRDEFLRTLLTSDVWIMEEGKEISTDAPSEGVALDHIRTGMKNLDAVESVEQIKIYIHLVEGQPILPFFSSPEFFEAFVKSLPAERITTFAGMSVRFPFLLNQQFINNHFILNPNTTAQRHVTVDDRKRLLELEQQSAG